MDLLPETSGLRGTQRHSGSASWRRCSGLPENSQSSLEHKRHVYKHGSDAQDLQRTAKVTQNTKDVSTNGRRSNKE